MIYNLPNEILLNIFSCSDLKTCYELKNVCYLFNLLINTLNPILVKMGEDVYNRTDLFEKINYARVILSEEFIEKFQDKVNWILISDYQVLSEEFIEKFQDRVNWENISTYQTLSEEFIEKF